MGNLADFFKQGISDGSKQLSDQQQAVMEANAKAGLSSQEAQARSALSSQQAQQEAQAAAQKQGYETQNFQTLLGATKKLPPGAGATMGGAGITRGYNPATTGIQAQKFETGQENKYAGALGKYTDADAAFHAVEDATNRDGKGGILTNPNATLQSAGKVMSVVPDTVLGVGELTGAVPKGTLEERKTIARLNLSLGHALTGARMNPTMQKMIKDSMGQLASGDPQLMAKGIRGAAGILGQQIKTVGSGFTDETRQSVHDRLGGDPNDFYGSVYKDAPGGKQASPQEGSTPSQAPSQPQGGFDPDAYLKGE